MSGMAASATQRLAGSLAFWLACVVVAPKLRADPVPQVPDAAAAQFFESDIRPLLIERCSKCHSGDKPKGGLRLDSRESLMAGGENGPVVVPGHPEQSR